MNTDVFLTRNVHAIVIGKDFYVNSWCDAALNVDIAREFCVLVRGTRVFSSRVASNVRAIDAPTSLYMLQIWPRFKNQFQKWTLICCNDFPVFDGSLCTLDLDAMKN